jgi:hypothetical protein
MTGTWADRIQNGRRERAIAEILDMVMCGGEPLDEVLARLGDAARERLGTSNQGAGQRCTR